MEQKRRDRKREEEASKGESKQRWTEKGRRKTEIKCVEQFEEE